MEKQTTSGSKTKDAAQTDSCPQANRLCRRNFEILPDCALISASEVCRLSGRSRTSVWRDSKNGLLPKPIRIEPNAVRWRLKDVKSYLNGGEL